MGIRARKDLGFGWTEYLETPEDLLMSLLWEHDRMTLLSMQAAGMLKSRHASKALSQRRQEYLQVYWDIARRIKPS